MRKPTPRLLRELERAIPVFGGDAAERKRELLKRTAKLRMPTAEAVLRLHECIGFLRAYPDDSATAALVESLASSFARRRDLRAHREALTDSGVAGTEIRYRFYWPTARWLTSRWPSGLTIDWDELDAEKNLLAYLGLLATPSEAPALDALDYPARDWIDKLRRSGETDAACLVRLFERIGTDEFWKERLFESLDTPFRISPGPGSPSRTLSRYGDEATCFQTRPLSRDRPDLRRAIRLRPRRVVELSEREGQRLIDLAREAMVTRSRDLDAFAHGDPRDVRLVEFEDGLRFACIGMLPERRLLLESVYGFLTLKNGVPIGYVLTASLFRSAEVAYNVFETFRGAEAGRVYARVLAMTRHLFGARSFSIDPYQLGDHNEEGLASGAWWFYYKFGFRPRDPEVRRILRQELRRIRRDPRHRSTRATLRRLVVAPMFWYAGRERPDVMGRFPLEKVGLRITEYLSRRFGGRRREGLQTCAEEAARLLGLRSLRRLTPGERMAWSRWSPLILILPGVEGWSSSDRQALIEVVRAKGGRREAEFVTRIDRHAKLRRAILRLSVQRRAAAVAVAS